MRAPTNEAVEQWLYAYAGDIALSSQGQDTSDGKWLLFADAAGIDGLWAAVSAAVERNSLGDVAKVSTGTG